MENKKNTPTGEFKVEVNELSESTKKSFKTRTITALVLSAILIPCCILGGWFFFGAVCILIGIAIYEFLKATGKKYSPLIWILTYVFTYSFAIWVFFQKSTSAQTAIAYYEPETFTFVMKDIRISTMGAGTLIAILFAISIFDKNFEVNDVFYVFSMSLFIGIAFQAILFLRYAPRGLGSEDFSYYHKYHECSLFFYMLMGTLLNDIFAYITGLLFGKHKMNPRVSPKKTWEGFAGGIILSAAFSVGYVLIMDKCFNMPPLKGIIDSDHILFVILTSLSLGLSAVLGDLMFSLIKRHYGIKDYGTIFPGHGGVLDRFDSVLISSLLLSLLITFIYYSPWIGLGL